jgi:hypothetical protein
MTAVSAKTSDRSVREIALRLKIRAVDVLGLLAREPDARNAFIKAWVLTVQSRIAGTGGEYSKSFGEEQETVITLLRENEQEILDLGRRHFGKEAIDKARDDVEALAARFPLTREFSEQLGSLTPVPTSNLAGDLGTILLSPILPVKTLQGVTDTPTAITRFSEQAGRIGTIIGQIPERARWEMELLLFELESLDTVVTASHNLDQIAKSFDKAQQSMDKLPAEVKGVLDDFLVAQPKLQETVKEVSEGLARADKLSASLRDVARDGKELAAAWQGAAVGIKEVLVVWQQLGEASAKKAEEEKDKEKEPPTDWALVADRVTTAAKEIQAVLLEIKRPLNEDAGVQRFVADTGEATRRSIDYAYTKSAELLDAVLWRGAILVACVVAGALIYRLLTAHLRRTEAAAPAPAPGAGAPARGAAPPPR